MKQSSSLWQAAGFALTTLGGTLLHFLYDWTGGSILVAPFSGINESTWEHMKLLFWPLFLFALIQRPFFKEHENFWCVKFAEIILGLTLIPVLFYSYNGAFGKSPDWINIAIFYISAAAAFLPEWWLFKQERLRCKRPWLAFASIFLIGALFVAFTFAPPQIPLFRDPLTENYGLAFSHCIGYNECIYGCRLFPDNSPIQSHQRRKCSHDRSPENRAGDHPCQAEGN